MGDDSFLYDDLSRLNNELVDLQRAMAKKAAELERVNDHKNQLLGMAAHDLRDPIGVIGNFSHYLHEALASRIDEQELKMLSMIESNCRFMSDMIDDLLEIVAIDAGDLRLRPEPTDLAEVVENNLTLHRVLAERKRMELEAELDRRLPQVTVDRGKFEQVLNNLISNAIKYSQPGSKITVRLKRADLPAILLQVSDQGQGIPEGEIDLLFQPFTRTSVRTTGGEKSTGLGLAIVKRIVEGHQGRVWVESVVSKGSTFSVELPMEVIVEAPDTGKKPA